MNDPWKSCSYCNNVNFSWKVASETSAVTFGKRQHCCLVHLNFMQHHELMLGLMTFRYNTVTVNPGVLTRDCRLNYWFDILRKYWCPVHPYGYKWHMVINTVYTDDGTSYTVWLSEQMYIYAYGHTCVSITILIQPYQEKGCTSLKCISGMARIQKIWLQDILQ